MFKKAATVLQTSAINRGETRSKEKIFFAKQLKRCVFNPFLLSHINSSTVKAINDAEC